MSDILGKRIAKERKTRNMLQADLANKLDVSKSTVGMWETGQREPDTNTINKIADLLGVTTDYLLGRTNDQIPVGGQLELGIDLHTLPTGFVKVNGHRMMTLRKQKYTDVDRFCIDLELHPNQYKLWETGYGFMSFETAEKIAGFIGTDVEYLLDLSDLEDSIPLINNMSAGSDLLSEQNIERYIPYPFSNKHQPDFAIRVKGDSMIGAGVLDGDIVFLRKAKWAEFNGQIVAAIVGEDVALKRMKWFEGSPMIKLVPENEEYETIEALPNEIQVCGLYAGLFRPEES